jgi:uncharacterized protein
LKGSRDGNLREVTTATTIPFLPALATAAAKNDVLVVSIHDVAPGNRPTVEKMVAELVRKGVGTTSLLVVPDYHHEGPVSKDPAFIAWLRNLQAEGHEIVIHGYFHERPRRPGESLSQRFLTRVYTQDEGEFFDLDYETALQRINTGRDQFHAAGLNPHGFIAPAWLLGSEAERAARDAGMEYTTRLNSIRDLRFTEDFPTRSLVYSVRNGWRRQASLLWNAALNQFSRHNEVLRLSIHPVDYSHPAIWSQICRFIDRAVPRRTPTTYRDWVADWRLQRDCRV